MEILADPITVNSRKVLAGLKLIGADFAFTKVDYFKGEQAGPDFMAINPTRRFRRFVMGISSSGNPTRSCSTRPTRSETPMRTRQT